MTLQLMESQHPHPQTIGTNAEESYLHLRRPLPIGHLLHKRYNLNADEPSSVPAPLPQQPEPISPQQEARQLLQEQDITPNEYDEQLRKAAENGNAKLLRLLIAAAADVNMADKNGNTPLNRAAANGRSECVKRLLAAPGIDVNMANKDGETPLYGAAREGNSECVKLLKAAGDNRGRF